MKTIPKVLFTSSELEEFCLRDWESLKSDVLSFMFAAGQDRCPDPAGAEAILQHLVVELTEMVYGIIWQRFVTTGTTRSSADLGQRHFGFEVQDLRAWLFQNNQQGLRAVDSCLKRLRVLTRMSHGLDEALNPPSFQQLMEDMISAAQRAGEEESGDAGNEEDAEDEDGPKGSGGVFCQRSGSGQQQGGGDQQMMEDSPVAVAVADGGGVAGRRNYHQTQQHEGRPYRGSSGDVYFHSGVSLA